MDHSTVFYELAGILALAAAIGLAGMLLKQPLVVAFIATGIIAGPDVLGLVHSADTIALLAEIGIAALLFLVGLKLDVQSVRSLGAVAVATGLGQVTFTAVVGFALCMALGFHPVTSVYVGVALTFSSTIIIVKLLSDKREVDSLHGRIAIGFLIVQDIVVVLAMITLSTIGVGTGGSRAGLGVGGVLGSGLLLVVVVGVFMRYLAEPLMRRIARMPELLVTFAIAWAMLFAAACDYIGLGKELGGLIAGVSLATTTYRESIASRLASLRDFLLLFFFIALGAGLRLTTLGAQVGPALLLSLFVLIGNPLIVMIIMGAMGYRKRTGLLAGLTVAQISEFSLIFMAMGVTLGHVSESSVGLVTLVGLVTITLSTYMILYSQTLYRWLEPYLGWLERRDPYREAHESAPAGEAYDVILFGLGRYGREIAKALRATDSKILGVDFDPEAVETWRGAGLPGVYGDAGDPEFPVSLPLARARWVIIATPPLALSFAHDDSRLVVMHAVRDAGFRGRIAIRSHDSEDAEHLRTAGADVVMQPFADAAMRTAELLDIRGDAPQKRETGSRAHPAPVDAERR
ncbi:MAG: cation:proton antiporter [Myxococcota bacterium]|nr:cation:proton antiporter [Myxococcota bacterium]